MTHIPASVTGSTGPRTRGSCPDPTSNPTTPPRHTVEPWPDRPDRTAGGVIGIEQWSGTCGGEGPIGASLPSNDERLNRSGGFCPKFAEARAKQALAERQLVEFNHRLVNMLQILVGRIERQRRMQDDPRRQDELAGLTASVRASAQLHRYLLPPRKAGPVDLGALLGNVAAAIERRYWLALRG